VAPADDTGAAPAGPVRAQATPPAGEPAPAAESAPPAPAAPPAEQPEPAPVKTSANRPSVPAEQPEQPEQPAQPEQPEGPEPVPASAAVKPEDARVEAVDVLVEDEEEDE
jgi:hypothetical protein